MGKVMGSGFFTCPCQCIVYRDKLRMEEPRGPRLLCCCFLIPSLSLCFHSFYFCFFFSTSNLLLIFFDI